MSESARKYRMRGKAAGTLTGPAGDAAGYPRDSQAREWVKMNADVAAGRRAQWWGGVICLVALGGAIITALAGAHPSVSVALVGIPIIASIRAISGGRRTRSPE